MMDQPRLDPTSIYIKVFCGEDSFLIWDESHHNFGICFQKSVMCGFSFLFLAIFSAFYAGKKTSRYIRSKSQMIIIILRITLTLVSLLLTVLQPCLLKLYAFLNVYWVDIFTSSVQAFTWVVHLAYLLSLRHYLSRGTRGPRPVIGAWVLTLICNVFSARTAWSINFQDGYIDDSHDVKFSVYLFRWIVTTQLILQILYLITLFPHGRCDDSSGSYSRVDERTPLLDTNYANYSRFQEAFDPLHLGVAEEGVNSLSYLTFYWVNSLMEKGSLSTLDSVDDLYDLPYSLRSEVVSQKVQKQMLLSQPLAASCEEEEKSPPKYLLLKALHRCFGLRFYSVGFFKLISDGFNFASPLLLNIIVRFVEGKGDIAIWKGYASGAGLCFAVIISSFSVVHFNYFIAKLSIQLRASLVTAIFRKIQNLSLSQLSAFSSGEIVNLMSTDTDRVINFCQSFHALWSLPLQLGVTFYLLYTQIGIAFLAGVLFAVFLIPINKLLASKIGRLSSKMMKFKDSRLDLMNDILSKIRQVKLNSWENLFKKKVMDERFGEVQALAGRKYLDAACVYFWAATPVLIPIITFGTYAALGNTMEPARVFTAVVLFNMLISPLNAFPWAFNGLVEAWVSMKRIERLMQMKDYKYNEYYTLVPEQSYNTSDVQVFIDGSFSWKSGPLCQELRRQTDPRTPMLEPSRRPPADSLGSNIFDSIHEARDDSSPVVTLKDINITLHKSQLIAVVGGVGSGKTALLFSILGELEKISGLISVAGLHRGFGLATQKPWLQNISIKDNIVFGHNFESSRYRSVLHACALEEDLHLLPSGDDTKCGENGASLSGGQRARVALARAVYQLKNIYVLDDVLSSVDGPVAQHIMDHCIHGLLAGRTVVMATNHRHLLAGVDWVVEMSNGKVIKQGPPFEVIPEAGVKRSLKVDVARPSSSSGAVPRYTSAKTKGVTNIPEDVDPVFSRQEKSRFADNNSLEVETISFGELSGEVYITYLTACGVSVSIFVFCSLLLMQASRNLVDVWLAKWSSHYVNPYNRSESKMLTVDMDSSSADRFNSAPVWHSFDPVPRTFSSFFSPHDFTWLEEQTISAANASVQNGAFVEGLDPTTEYYLIVYIVLSAFNSVFTLLRAFLFAYGGICAAKALHKQLLDAVIHSKITFFDLNPVGRILNRFSTDIYTVDDTLPFQANIFFAQLFGLLGCLFITIYGLPWISLLYIPLLFMYYTVQHYYRHTSRNLRRIYALSLSPLYSHFTDTLRGLPIIRAFRTSHRFSLFTDAFLEQNQRAQFGLMITSQWLNLRFQLIGVGILIGVILLAFWEHHIKGISPGLVGLVISYALVINTFLNGVVTYLTETERELISVERIHQYLVGTPREGQDGVTTLYALAPSLVPPPIALPYGWPNQGQIVFENVHLRYHDHNPYALMNITFTIQPMEKVGIVGRTGAGKSSIFMALFRLVELARGKIFIDNVDISEISIKKLRTSMAIVSQDVLLFSGTVRENLDPRGENLDREIMYAIEHCHLSDVVARMGGMDAPLKAGQELSDGERQLLCLARALLSRSKIVCLDEGMALLDTETEAHVQSVVREAFRNKTVLVIAHRLHSVRDCQRVIVLSDGEIAEVGRPLDLIEDKNSLFHSMVQFQS